MVSKTKILSWLLNRIQHKQHDENRGYTAELLSILLQDNTANKLELGKENGVEIILKVLSVPTYSHEFGYSTNKHSSDIVGETLLTQTKLSLWKTYLIHFVLHCQNHQSKTCSLKQKDLIL